MDVRTIDRTGMVFGMLTIVSFDKKDGATGLRWFCKCECGVIKSIIFNSLMKGRTTSCGCNARSKAAISLTKHGMARTKTYKSWHSMTQRAMGKKGGNYQSLGMFDGWKSFDVFFKDMGERPEGKTLDRIDNTIGYFPGNCRWANGKTQANNKSTTAFVDFGDRCVTVSMAAELLNVTQSCIRHRITSGKLKGLKMSDIEKQIKDRKGRLDSSGVFIKE